jgi:hypothetical protein
MQIGCIMSYNLSKIHTVLLSVHFNKIMQLLHFFHLHLL